MIWDEPGKVYANDDGFIELVLTEEDGTTMRDLTGCGVFLSFWRPDAAGPHVVRAAKVTDPTNGIALYRLEGDEYSTADKSVLWQATVHETEFSSTTTGRGGFQSTGPIVRRRILPTP